ncbi:MAG: HAD family hydrolase [Eubacteriaceae bacterium]|nr:HAD family hydrolase [Eubacteriaceae bacterium]
MIKAILFDLDGTLVPMDQRIFVEDYIKKMAEHMAPYGYTFEEINTVMWKGTEAMVKNDGSRSNYDAFWETAEKFLGKRAIDDIPKFDEFYVEKFDKVKEVCGYEEKAAQTVRKLRNDGYTIILATNPIFPRKATEWRIKWLGMEPEEFDLYTTYENSFFSKPNPKYYEEILSEFALKPEECLMVGNDTRDDMVTRKMGMKVFLRTNYLIHREDYDIDIYPNGDFEELLEYIEKIKNEE